MMKKNERIHKIKKAKALTRQDVESKKLRILFIGIGTMGYPMCLNLHKAGYKVEAFNRTYDKALGLKRQGIKVLKHLPNQLDYDIILSTVSDDKASENVFWGKYQVLKKMKANTIVLECSTLSPDYILQLNEAVKKKASILLDAPVSGSLPEANDGTLLFLAGGDTSVVEAIEPMLLTMGKQVYRMGEVGNGMEMKLANNILNGVQMLILGEVLLFVEACKIDFNLFADIVSNGQPGSPIIKAKLQRLKEKMDSPVQAKISIIKKDLLYAEQIAKKHGLPLMLTSTAANIFGIAEKNGHGDEDVSNASMNYKK